MGAGSRRIDQAAYAKDFASIAASAQGVGSVNMLAYTLDTNAVVYYTGDDEKAVASMRTILLDI
ncbi:MAG TPA: hypothetical protein VJL57_01565 [Candidatus Paceibacterota bacterium]